jgi:dTDP-4-dehydrorhamnose reductase
MRFLVTGAAGQLGSHVLEEMPRRGHECVAWGRTEGVSRRGISIEAVELEADGLKDRLDRASPDVVLHLAAMSTAEGVRIDPERGWRVNVEATRRIADWCARRGRGLVFTSTDMVFGGDKAWNREDDPAEPVLGYGRTKREAESAVVAIPRGLVVRLSLLYGFSRTGRATYLDRTIGALRRGEPQTFFEDEFRTPLDLATAATAQIRLAEVGATGIVHVGGVERLSRFELVRRAAVALGLDPELVRANRRADAISPEPRPADVSLDTSRLASILADLHRPIIEDVFASDPDSRETVAPIPV